MPMARLEERALRRTWLHSHEEDGPGRRVYRPSSWDFPPSRGRTGFQLKAGGVVKELGIGPADGTASATGRWEVEGEGPWILILRLPGRPDQRLGVVEASPERLVIEPPR